MFFYIRYKIYNFLSVFNYETSEIDWCECNYKVVTNICEFANTLTSIWYIFLSFFGLYHLKKIYTNRVVEYIIIYNFFYKIYLLLALLGLYTFYFHATLSYAGQILDEVSILILIFTINIEPKINVLQSVMFIPSMFIFPSINRLLLFAIGIYRYIILYSTLALVSEVRIQYSPEQFKKILYRGTTYLIRGLICWIVDIVCCDHLVISLHWLWHIYSGLALYYFIVYTLWLNLYKMDKHRGRYKFNVRYIFYVPYIESIDMDRLIL